MEDRRGERLSAATGLVATLSVGVAALLAGFGDSSGPGFASAPLWWASYAAYLAAFALDAGIVRPRPRWAAGRRLLTVEVVAGAAAWMASPALTWTAVLLVVTAASAAYVLPARGALLVVAGQTLLVALGCALDGQTIAEVVTATAIFGSFQAFAVMVVGAERREAAARAELAAAHAELRGASALLAASARTTERLRISRDLHDAIGHQLTALTLELEVAAHHCDGDAARHVGRARTIAKDLLSEVRETVGALRTGPDDLELTLRALVSEVPGLTVDVDVDERAALDEAAAVAVVRCVQEILTNTLRHAGADRLAIRVDVDASGVFLDARDDGAGAAQLTLGNGLTGMRERVEQLGGDVHLDTGAGKGFAVTVRVPTS